MTYKSELASDNPTFAHFFLLELDDTTKIRFTDYGRNTAFDDGSGSETFYSSEIEIDTQEQETGIKVGERRLTFYLSPEMITELGLNLYEIKIQRQFDRAELTVFEVSINDPASYVIDFFGDSGLVEITNLAITAQFRDIFFMLNKIVPEDTYGESCNKIIFSDRCKLVRSTIEVTGSADAGSTDKLLVDSVRTEADDWFDRGSLEMTSGVNNGLRRQVRASIVGQVALLQAFPNAIGTSDIYKLVPSCQKTWAGCNRFNNKLNHLGYQFVPTRDEVDSRF